MRHLCFYSYGYYMTCLGLAVLMAVSTACTGGKCRDALARAEAVMLQRPDSALLILEGIDRADVSSDRDKALYYLLMTQARDKNHLPLCNDTMISFSVDYFDRERDSRYLMLSHYFYGRVLSETGDLPVAILSFIQASDIAERLDDRFWVGMASRGLSDIYQETFNGTEELAYAEKEYTNIKASGLQPYVNYSLLDLARAQNNSGNYADAIRTCKEILDSASRAGDDVLYDIALNTAAASNLGNKNPAGTVRCILELCDRDNATFEDSAFLATAYAWTGNLAEASEILGKLEKSDTLPYVYAAYNVYKAEGNMEQALKNHEVMSKLKNRLVNRQLDRGLTSSVANNFNRINQQKQKDLVTSRNLLWVSIIAASAVILLLCLAFVTLIRKQRRETSDKILFAEQLQEQFEKINTDNLSSLEALKGLMAERYKLLSDLCRIVADNQDSKSARQKVADSVTTLIKEVSLNGNKLQELQNYVDTLYSNLFSDFCIELPDLKDSDYALFLFSVLRFPSNVIALLLKEEKVNAIYDRRRRLKDKIRRLDSVKSSRFLSYI